jgi:hypothetical protein
MHSCNLNHSGGGGRRILSLRTAQTKLVRPYLKNKRSGSVAQVVEHLPSMCKIPMPRKRKKKNPKLETQPRNWLGSW